MESPEIILAKKLAKHFAVKSIENQMSVKDVDMSKRTVTGIYNTMLYFDSDQDIIMPGAFNKSIAERGPDSSAPAKIKHALFHDINKLPGKIQVLEQREIDGKTVEYFETKMSTSTDGNDTLIKYQDEIYDQHSIGFRYINDKIKYVERGDEEYEKTLAMIINPDDVEKFGYFFKVDEVMQFEGSTVAFGANQLSAYLGVKSTDVPALLMKLNEKLDKLESVMKNGNLSDDGFSKLNLEIRQIKQIFVETLESQTEPEIKSTLKKEPLDDATKDKERRKQLIINLHS